ncbi:MFS transporter [Bacillus toyonensis]
MKALFKNRAFMLVMASDILQQFAIWIRNMALLYFIMERTNNDPVSVSLLSVMEYAPIFIFSFIGGALADRWNPKRTMVAGDVLSVLSIIGIVLLLKIDYWQAIFFATLVSAIVGQFSQPSSSRIFKRYVKEEQVANAIAFNQTLQSLFMIFGPVVGSLVYTQLGLFTSLYSLIILFLLSAIALSFLPKWIEQEQAVKGSLKNDIKEGWKYVLHTKNLRMITITFTIMGLAVGLTNPLEVFLVIERLGMEKEAVQYLATDGWNRYANRWYCCFAVFASKVNPKKMFVFGMSILAISFLVEGLSTSFWITSLMRFGTGICLACVNIVVGTLMIQLVPENMIGRVNGTILPMFMGAMLIGTSLAGGLKEMTSLVIVFCIAMSLILLAIGPALRMQINKEDVANKEELTNSLASK